MRKIWREFKSFALSGSMLDLALGFIIGTAFATVVTSATDHLLTPLISAAFGKTSFEKLHGSIAGTRIPYGLFLNDMLNFFLFALILFLLLKMISAVGWGRARTFEERQCPYCLEYIAPNSLVCKVCRQPLVADMPDLAVAETRAAKLRERRHLNLPDLPEIELRELIAVPRVRRRPGGPTSAAKPAVMSPEDAHRESGHDAAPSSPTE
jgi:large conductance mechanosensitive channel